MRAARLILAALLLLVLVACSDDGDDGATATTGAGEEVDQSGSTDVTGLDGSEAAPCAEVWAEGADADEALEVGDDIGCVDEDGELLVVGNAFDECEDGRTLYWNDQGWGYGGETWHRHDRADGQLVPPDDETAACAG